MKPWHTRQGAERGSPARRYVAAQPIIPGADGPLDKPWRNSGRAKVVGALPGPFEDSGLADDAAPSPSPSLWIAGGVLAAIAAWAWWKR